MHPGQQRIVAPVIEVRDPAFLRTEIADWRGQVDGPDAAPTQANRRFDIEIEASHPKLAPHDPLEGRHRIDAKPKKRIADAAPQSFNIGPPIGDFTALDA